MVSPSCYTPLAFETRHGLLSLSEHNTPMGIELADVDIPYPLPGMAMLSEGVFS